MKKRKLLLFLETLLCSSVLIGCGSSSFESEEIIEDDTPSYVFDTTGEDSELGIPLDDKNTINSLENNTFYVVHNSIAYPIYFEETSSYLDDSLEEGSYIDTNRKLFYSSTTEHNIPTLYKGDYLIYYSTDTLLDTIVWERFYDDQYSIGLYNLEKMTSDRYKINLEDDDDYPVLQKSSLYPELSKISASELLVDKIATVPVTSDFVENGIIKGLTKDTEYNIELYTGSQFLNYNTAADYHMFTSYEAFLSTDYETKQIYVYNIDIPDYFVTGYYSINNVGLFRYIKDDNYYNSDTNFNEPLLYLSDEEIEDDEVKYIYSSNPDLNSFVSSVPDTLGYVDPDAPVVLAENQEIVGQNEDGTPIVEFKKTVTKEFELWLPENMIGQISIDSYKNEKTGKISLTTENGTKEASYDPISKNYVLEVNGKGEKATLEITGFYNSYDIVLTNIEEYSEQDKQIVSENTINTVKNNDTNSNSILKQNTDISTSGLIIYIGASIIIVLFYMFINWIIFAKAGVPGWKSLIPIYNLFVSADIVFHNKLLGLLSMIPITAPFYYLIYQFKLSKAFGKNTLFNILNIIVPFITLPILAFGNCEYENE